jgi:hypothetical protein
MASIVGIVLFNGGRVHPFQQLQRPPFLGSPELGSHNWKLMEAIPAASDSQASSPQQAIDVSNKSLKRCMMTYERLIMVTNTLMDPVMMNEYGLILETTPKGGYKNGTKPFFIKLASFFTEKQQGSMQGTELGEEALKSWITAIKTFARQEADRQEIERSKGRNGSENPPESHITACYELMQQFLRFQAEKKKNPQNRYSAKPKGLEHLELQKTDGPSLAEFDSAGKNMQDDAVDVVREARKKARRQLSEEGMAATGGASKESFKPQLKPPESSDDQFNFLMTKVLEADAWKTGQEALKMLEERRASKWTHVQNLRSVLNDPSTDETMKGLLQQQIKNGLLAMAKIDEEEQVVVPHDLAHVALLMLSSTGSLKRIESVKRIGTIKVECISSFGLVCHRHRQCSCGKHALNVVCPATPDHAFLDRPS